MHAIDISRSGLDVEWRRLEVIAQNIANASTVNAADGQPYRAQRLLSGPRADFKALLAGEKLSTADLSGVQVYGVEALDLPPQRVYEPAHPQADADGYVNYPGFDHAAEMVLMVKTARAYEANVVSANTARQMYMKALEIGGRS